jgi:flagellar hook-length control protein FliK
VIDDIRQLLARASPPVRSAPEPESGAFDSAFSDALGQRNKADAGNRGPADPAARRQASPDTLSASRRDAAWQAERAARSRRDESRAAEARTTGGNPPPARSVNDHPADARAVDARAADTRATDTRATEARLASERMARTRDRAAAPAGQRLSQPTTGSAPTGRADGPGHTRDIDDRRAESANGTSTLTQAPATTLTPAPASPPAPEAAATGRTERADGTNGPGALPGSTTDGLTRETAAAGHPPAGPATPPGTTPDAVMPKGLSPDGGLPDGVASGEATREGLRAQAALPGADEPATASAPPAAATDGSDPTATIRLLARQAPVAATVALAQGPGGAAGALAAVALTPGLTPGISPGISPGSLTGSPGASGAEPAKTLARGTGAPASRGPFGLTDPATGSAVGTAPGASPLADPPMPMAASQSTQQPLALATAAASLAAARQGEAARSADRTPAAITARDNTAANAPADWRNAMRATVDSPAGAPRSQASALLDSLQEMRLATGAPAGGASPTGVGSDFAGALAMASQGIATPATPPPAEPARLANPWPIHEPTFHEHLAGQVGETLMAGIERAEITLSPPELGPIRIELSLSGESASIAFSATQPETRTAIEQSLPTLRTMLADHGLQLSQASVNGGSADGAGSQARQSGPGNTGSPGESGGLRGRATTGGPEPALARVPRATQGLLDTFA